MATVPTKHALTLEERVEAACKTTPPRTINTVGDLRRLLATIPDDARIKYADFGGDHIVAVEHVPGTDYVNVYS